MVVTKGRSDEEQNECGGLWNSMDIGSKISRVCYAGEQAKNVDLYLTGTWNENVNKLSLWKVYYGRAQVTPDKYFSKANDIELASSVNGICRENLNVVAGLENGDLEVCLIDKGERLLKVNSLRKVHGKYAGSTSVCIVDGEIISGSDNGSIMRMDLATTSKPSVLSTDLNSVKCMIPCGQHEFVSGHSSGQIHLWDVRQINPAIVMGEMPVYSKAVSPLTDAITSLDSHPGQPNVIGYGTFSGSTSFIDIRYHRQQATPNLLKLSQEPITDIKFHPVFPTNCFVLSGEALLHLDLSMGKPEMFDPEAPIDDMAGHSKANVWLTAASWNMLDIGSMLSDGPKRLNSLDLSSHSLLCGSLTNSLSLLTNARFY